MGFGDLVVYDRYRFIRDKKGRFESSDQQLIARFVFLNERVYSIIAMLKYETAFHLAIVTRLNVCMCVLDVNAWLNM